MSSESEISSSASSDSSGSSNSFYITTPRPKKQQKLSKKSNNMRTRAWGQPMWYSMIFIAMGYPEDSPTYQQRTMYALFFNLLGELLPCNLCRDSYKLYIEEDPVEQCLNSRRDLVFWIFKIHNKVNKKLQKKELSLKEFIKVYDFFDQFRAQNCKKTEMGCTKPLNRNTIPKRTYIVTEDDLDVMF